LRTFARRTSKLLDLQHRHRDYEIRRVLSAARILRISPRTTVPTAYVRTGRLPFPPVRFLLSVIETVVGTNLFSSSVKTDQVVLSVRSPSGPRVVLLAVIANVVLERVTTALTTPSIFVDGDTDPRILLRASTVTDGHTFCLSSTLFQVGTRLVTVTVTRNFLTNASGRKARSIHWHGQFRSRLTNNGSVRSKRLARVPSSATLIRNFLIHKVRLPLFSYFLKGELAGRAFTAIAQVHLVTLSF
jgi:hypothetical protein